MKSYKRHILTVILLLLIVPSILAAQPDKELFPPNDNNNPPLPPPPGKHGDIYDTMQTVMLIEMVQFVGLTNEEALKLSPTLDEIAKLREANKKSQKENLDKLQNCVKMNSGEKEIKPLIEKIIKEQKDFKNKEFELREKMLVGLTPIKQAKMVLFYAQFTEKMHRIMGQARDLRGLRDKEQNRQKDCIHQEPQVEEEPRQP
jgi:hypothetical protein